MPWVCLRGKMGARASNLEIQWKTYLKNPVSVVM